MRICTFCGTALQDNQKYCEQCGRDTESVPADPASPGKVPHITWTAQAPLVKNPEVHRGYLILFLVVFLIGGALAFMTANIYVLYMFLGIVIALIILFFIISLILEWTTRGGLEIGGIIDSRGVAHSVGKTSRNITRGGLILGSLASLAGSRTGTVVMGGSLISLSQERSSIRWQDIRSVKIYPNEKLIVVRDASAINPVALYCTQDNFHQVLDIIRKQAPPGTKFS